MVYHISNEKKERYIWGIDGGEKREGNQTTKKIKNICNITVTYINTSCAVVFLCGKFSANIKSETSVNTLNFLLLFILPQKHHCAT